MPQPQQAPGPLSLAQMGRMLLNRPEPAPDVRLPRDAPNRPLGTDWFSDGMDALLGGLGINNPLDPEASSASQLGGMFSAAIPLGAMRGGLQSVGTLGRAAKDMKQGFVRPVASAPITELRRREMLEKFGGSLGQMTAPPLNSASVYRVREAGK